MPLLPENVVALGRIGGPLLDRNLKRKNAGTGEENLSFGNTDLVNPNVLYLDIINGRVGINTNVPSHDLTVLNPRTTNLIVPTQTEIANFVVTTNVIQNIASSITLQPDQSTDPIIDIIKIGTYDYGSSIAYLNISDQLIENIRNNSDIELSPNGTGEVNITTSELYVDGDFSATGTVTWDGSLITLGSDDTDNVEFKADVNSNIVPNIDQTYDLGTALKRWNTVYTKNISVSDLVLDTAEVNGIDMLLTQGNTIYVSVYGNDANVGTHLHNTYRTVKYALSQATAGDTVVIFPGTYVEDFPLTVPAGVTVNGAGIRAVSITPTIGTRDKDAFLLNGETTVSNLSVVDFDYNSINNTGYAFRLAPNITVTSRSPYVQNTTVITAGVSPGRGALVDGGTANSSSKEASMLFHSVTMIVPSSVGIMATNGARVEWLNSFTYFAEKGIYLTQGTQGFGNSTYTYDSVTGKYLSTSAVRFSAPYDTQSPNNVNPTNATAFKFRAGSIGRIAFGTTLSSQYDMRVLNLSTTRISIYAQNSSTLITQFTIFGNGTNSQWVLSSGQLFTSGSASNAINYPVGADWATVRGLLTNGTVYDWVFVPNNSTFTGYKTAAELGLRFGAEMRSIGSANVYGTYGAVADGADTIAYLINHNFAYVGTGTDYTNDPGLVVQANEVLEQNNGRIYYESTDHKGDFRIGDIFYVNQETGAVTFNAQSISFLPNGNITLTGPTSSAFVDATMIEVGNIRISGNTIESLTGPVNFLANSGTTTLNTDVFVTGNTDISADVIVRGNLFLGDQSTDTITFYPNFTQDLLPDDVGPAYGYTLGSTGKRWNTLFSNAFTVDNVIGISNNTISTLTANTDLVLQAATTGKVRVTNTDVQVDQNLTIGGTTFTVNGISNLKDTEVTGTLVQTGNWGQTGSTDITGNVLADNLGITGAGSYFTVPNFKLQNNQISVTTLNTDLVLYGLGTGSVVFENIVKISGTTIEVLPGIALTESGNTLVTESGVPYALEGDVNASENITFQPNGTGNTVIYGTKALKIPVGNSSNRLLGTNEIRYNSTTNLFEGANNTGALISFNDVYDSDRNTYVKTGPTDNTLYFGVNSSVKATINSTALQTSTFNIDNIQLNSNTISNTASGNDLIFTPTGTGNTLVNNVGFSADSTITNQTNQSLILKSTGTGYVSFAAASALIIPYGVSADRRPTPEIGEVRYNTDFPRLEVYTGDPGVGENGWVTALGEAAGIVDANVIEGLLDFWTLILG